MTETSDFPALLRNGFITGLVFIAPLVVTVLVLSIVYGWLVGLMKPILELWFQDVGHAQQLLGILVLVAGLTGLGVLIRQGAGDTLVVEFDQIMERIPVISAVYSPTREASTALMDHGEQFDRVALVEWPREGVRTIGFVTDETPENLIGDLEADEQYYDVFVPMSPNPMGGFLVIIPESDLIMTDLSVQEGLEMVITTGMSGDGEFET